MKKNQSGEAGLVGSILIGEAMSDPLSNTKRGLSEGAKAQGFLDVFSHIRDFRKIFIFWIAGCWTTHYLFSADAWFLVTITFMFVFFIGMPLFVLQGFCWHVRAKMLTRVFPALSLPWKMLSQCHGYSGKTAFYFASLLMIIYPFTFGPTLLVWDSLRLTVSLLTLGKYRFGGDQYVWYAKQANLYNKTKEIAGTDYAENVLRLSASGVDIPVESVNNLTHSDWMQKYKEIVIGQKIRKYGDLFK